MKPGETFSYWRLIGNTTRRKGYQDGMVLFHGKVQAGVGGGLCQLSNLIYILNETTEEYQLVIRVTDTHLVGEWRAVRPTMHTYEIYENKHWITREYWGGYVRHNEMQSAELGNVKS